MDISKKKVEKSREWSANTQKALVSMLGVSAVTIIAACSGGDPVVSGGDIEDADSSSSEVVTDGMGPIDDRGQDISSSSEKAPNSSDSDPVAGISSSSYEIDTLEVTSGEVIPPEIVGPESGSNIDIGHLESSSSSYQRIESSSTTSGLPHSSSDAIMPSSSSTESGPLAGDPAVTEPAVEPGPMLSGVIVDTPVHVDEPKQ